MSFAVRYHRWLLDEFRPYLGKHVVEVGAGTGSFSEMLLACGPSSLSLIEPSEMFDELTRNISADTSATSVRFFNSKFESIASELSKTQRPDTVIYVNVLEHIEDDDRELTLIHESLCENGRCLIFVPALPSLFSSFDLDIGHFRRYRKLDLEKKIDNAGFKLLKSRYFDIAGIAPWYLKYRLLNSRSMEPGAVNLYDRLCVPVMRRVESIVKPPIGKNILLAAEKRG